MAKSQKETDGEKFRAHEMYDEIAISYGLLELGIKKTQTPEEKAKLSKELEKVGETLKYWQERL